MGDRGGARRGGTTIRVPSSTAIPRVVVNRPSTDRLDPLASLHWPPTTPAEIVEGIHRPVGGSAVDDLGRGRGPPSFCCAGAGRALVGVERFGCGHRGVDYYDADPPGTRSEPHPRVHSSCWADGPTGYFPWGPGVARPPLPATCKPILDPRLFAHGGMTAASDLRPSMRVSTANPQRRGHRWRPAEVQEFAQRRAAARRAALRLDQEQRDQLRERGDGPHPQGSSSFHRGGFTLGAFAPRSWPCDQA